MLRLLKICNQSTRRTQRISVNGKTFEAAYPELILEFIFSRALHKGPLFKRSHIIVRKFTSHRLADISLHDQFFRAKGREKRTDVFHRTLSYPESAGRYVKECRTALRSVKMKSRKEIVLMAFEHALSERDAGRQNLRHTSFHKLCLHQCRVFQLIANGDLISGTDDFREI